MDTKTVSIVIPCKNEEKHIARCIQSFIDIDYPKQLIEIIVVDGNSTDKSQEIVKQFQQTYKFLRLIINPKVYTAFALNLGIKNAKNEFIMIASAHSSFSKNYISEILSKILELRCDGAGGVIITDVKNKTKKTLSICKVLSNKFGVGNSMFRVGTGNPILVDIVPFGIYKKKLFDSVGYYDDRLIRNQDMEFSKRLIANKNKIYLIPSAKCTYFARETYKDIAINNFGNGLWIPKTIYITKRLNSLSIRHFIPMIFMLSLIIPILFVSKIPSAIFISLTSLILYLSAVFFVTFRIRNSSTTFRHTFWAFIVLHFSYGLGSIIGIFSLSNLIKKSNERIKL